MTQATKATLTAAEYMQYFTRLQALAEQAEQTKPNSGVRLAFNRDAEGCYTPCTRMC